MPAVLLAAALAVPAQAAACTTGPDEPPCNPYLADSPYPTAHGNNYATDSTALRGPESADEVTVVHRPVAGIPLGAIPSAPYSDGKRAIWAPGITGFRDSLLYKIDEDTAEVIDVYHRTTDEQTMPKQEPAIGGVYGVVTRENLLIRAAGGALETLTDETAGERTSPIKLAKRWPLPASAKCAEDDFVVGVTLLYDGRVAFSTRYGMVGVVPRLPAEMTDANLVTHKIANCSEGITNSVVADEDGGLYVLTDHAQYRFDTKSGLKLRWRAAYKTGEAGGGGVRQDTGSGSTPTLMGTRAGEDRFVVITDGQELMHLVLIDRDNGRIACEHPITFGDPTRTRAVSEQSVAVRGYASFVPNNQLQNTEVYDAIPHDTAHMAIAGLSGQNPAQAPKGFERIDWDPKTKTCTSKWANQDVSIPNGVPFLSAGSRLVYGIGQRDGINGLEAMDMDTGKSKFWVPAGPAPSMNAFYTAISINSDRALWTGGFFGYTKYEVGTAG